MASTITTANASSSVKGLIAELEEFITASNLVVREAALNALDIAAKCLEKNFLNIFVAFDPTLSNSSIEKLIRWLAPILKVDSLKLISDGKLPQSQEIKLSNVQLNFTLFSLLKLPGKKAGVPPAGILLCAVNSQSLSQEIVLSNLSRLSDNCPVAFLVTASDQQTTGSPKLSTQLQAWYSKQLPLNELSEPTFVEVLTSSQWKTSLEFLKANAAASATSTLAAMIKQAVDREEKTLAAKRLLLPRSPTLMMSGSRNTEAQMIGEIRGKIQLRLQEFEADLSDHFDNLISPNIGKLWADFETKVQSLVTLDSTDKVKSAITTIPSTFQNDLLEFLRQRLYDHCSADMLAIRDLFNEVSDEIEKTLTKLEASIPLPQFQHLTDERLNRILGSTVFIERPYRGELPRRGFTEYFSGARRYQIIFYMFATLLGGGLSRLKYSQEFLGFTLILLAVGAVATVRSVKRERVEGYARELEKARECLQTEAKRICADVKRQWLQFASPYLRDHLMVFLTRLEQSLREKQKQKELEAIEEKARLQRQQQALDAEEKTLLDHKKRLDTINKKIESSQRELAGVLKSELKNLEAGTK